MEQSDINLIASQASPNQVDAIIRRSTSGHGGTICKPRNVRYAINDYHGDGRFKWLKKIIHTLRNSCD